MNRKQNVEYGSCKGEGGGLMKIELMMPKDKLHFPEEKRHADPIKHTQVESPKTSKTRLPS